MTVEYTLLALAVPALLAAAGFAVWTHLRTRRMLDTLGKMLDDAIRGEFRESLYDESRLSALETRMAHYLSASAVSAKNLAEEKDAIKTLIGDISHQTKTPIANLLLYAQLLEEQGITGLVIDDEGDFRDFLEHNHQYWDYVDEELMQEKQGLCRITFYLSDDPEGYHRLAQVRMALSQLKAAHPEYAPLLLTMNDLEDADWENNWKQFYKPMEIGERLIVVPEWEQANTQGRIPLILNPGLTFGTGSHATTRLCLTALEETIHGGERVLDLGCGSGILSIAALRLGAEHAFACDIDEKCVEVAYENAALNGIDRSRYTVRWGDVLSDQQLKAEIGGGYDMVVANIVADVIIGLSGQVRPFLKEDGLFLCSGIIDDRAEEVARHLREAGWDILRTRQSEGWFSYLCR